MSGQVTESWRMIKRGIFFVSLVFIMLTTKTVDFSLINKDPVIFKKLIETMPLTNENLSTVLVSLNLLEYNDPVFFKTGLDDSRIKLFDQIDLNQFDQRALFLMIQE